MESSGSAAESTVSLLRAIDGSHLGWSDFRTSVLSAFRIVFNDSMQLAEISGPFADRLQPCLQNLSRFSAQEREWRNQLATGKGFSSTLIFPPNALPPISESRLLHRCLAPKLNREALPPRAVKAQESIFELPAPRPSLITGFKTSAFSENELTILPNCTSAAGTIVDFATGTVSPGTTTYSPFLVFERMSAASGDAVQSAKNHCAVAGAHCVRAMQLLFRRCSAPNPVLEKPISFSCAIDNSTAIVNYHHIDADGRYCMSEISRFDLDDTKSFKEFQGWIEAIEQWGSMYLLPALKISLGQMLRFNDTPPISPMPSLTLSIDTAAGSEDVLLKILRTTFSSIKWRSEGEYDTPLNSSIAHCGTPVGARKIRTMALSPTSPADRASAASPAGPNTPFRMWRMKPDWGIRSPVGRKHPLSPLKLRSDMPESPCRPATLSPCTPPPDAPTSAKSPMLVLQKRMGVAMDEIQELRAMVQALQTELQLRNSCPEADKKEPGLHSCGKLEDYPIHPSLFSQAAVLFTKAAAVASGALFLFSRSSFPALLVGSVIFLTICIVDGHDHLESMFCLAIVFVTTLNG
ncbi:hypothetical protein A1O3_04426 [Capronia epimyces CBS 606.96]|uniref:DUF7924 domain-containing protein n=1 Tax=Capronia epimyces CBS 606.96 TaxID=1182542 RepID=W9YDY2_9EURO|nr:uncharacterized protein A1O3_04426 [Capronia epimyces CBS 606.96]EXJ87466.1 hypothetical protein A1O3_04426 [Capronia epimyces CBS 606.96]